MPTLETPAATARPRPPLPTPFFYGWVIVGLCMLATCIAAFSSQNITSLMVGPILDEMKWTRTEIAAALGVGSLVGSFLAPAAGFLADRYGPRLLLTGGALAMAAAMFALGNMHTMAEFFIAYTVVRGVGPVVMSGAGVQTTVVNWFVQKRGRAMGITSMTWQLFVSLFAPICSALMVNYGWRSVFGVLGGAAALGAIPLLLLLRRRPEDVGLHPDGGDGSAEANARGGNARKGAARSLTLKQAMRTRALWMMCGAQLCGSLGAQSASFHWVPHFGQVGFEPVTVATMLSVYTMAAAFSNGMWGFLSERFSERMLAMITMSCGFVLVLSMMMADSVPWAMVTVGLFGLSSRGESAMFSLVLARFFGRDSFGRIAGVVQPFGAVGASLAPLLGGVIFDVTGHYSALYGTLAVVYALAFTFLLLAADPQRNLPPVAEGAA